MFDISIILITLFFAICIKTLIKQYQNNRKEYKDITTLLKMAKNKEIDLESILIKNNKISFIFNSDSKKIKKDIGIFKIEYSSDMSISELIFDVFEMTISIPDTLESG